MRPGTPFSALACCASAAGVTAYKCNWNGIVNTLYSEKLEPGRRRYLAIHLPFLPAERLIGARLAPPDAPFAVTEKERGALCIVALSRAAMALGLTPGMVLADARAQVPGLPAFPYDAEADHSLLMRIVEMCERYTPTVMAAGDASLILDLTGCLEGLGMTKSQLAGDVEARLIQLGLRGMTAWAATPDAALALARFGKSHVQSLPVAALDMGEETHIALRRAGLRSIQDLAARPRAPLAARFGTELPLRLARLLEEEDPRITPHRSPPPIYTERRFAEPMVMVGPLLGVIERLANEVGVVLAERGSGGRRFEIVLFRTDGRIARLAVDSGLPLRDPPAIARLFGERLESLADPLDPGFGYDMIRLSVPLIETLDEKQAELAEDRRKAPDLAPLLDRLIVRFGPESVRRFQPRDEHLPEYAARLSKDTSSGHDWPSSEAREPPLRPLFLFNPPQRVTVLAEVPDGPPGRFAWRGQQYLIVRHEGPERIAYPWWKHPEGAGPTRDYYRVEDETGHRFWLFRHGLYGREAPNPDWYLHGLFA